jgi:DNA polymerase-3 subunit epsilon
MILGFIDLETTGLKAEEGHRITEIALVLVELRDGKFTPRGKFSTLINPKRSIPDFIQGLTGITPVMVSGSPTWEELSPKISKILTKVDCLIAHNIGFDAPFLAVELVRVGEEIPNVETYCTMDNGRFATALGRVPKLSKLCEVLDVEFNAEDAHRAIYDTEKLAEAFISGFNQGVFKFEEASIKEGIA